MAIKQTISVKSIEVKMGAASFTSEYQVTHHALYVPKPFKSGMCAPPSFTLQECKIHVEER